MRKTLKWWFYATYLPTMLGSIILIVATFKLGYDIPSWIALLAMLTGIFMGLQATFFIVTILRGKLYWYLTEELKESIESCEQSKISYENHSEGYKKDIKELEEDLLKVEKTLQRPKNTRISVMPTGEEIKRMRIKLGLNVNDVYNATNIRVATINNIEKSNMAGYERARKLFNYYLRRYGTDSKLK